MKFITYLLVVCFIGATHCSLRVKRQEEATESASSAVKVDETTQNPKPTEGSGGFKPSLPDVSQWANQFGSIVPKVQEWVKVPATWVPWLNPQKQ